MWCYLALGVGVVIALIGLKKSTFPRRKPEPKPEPEHLWSKEYRQMYRDCIYNAEHVYCRK